jgi:hypothetical protein
MKVIQELVAHFERQQKLSARQVRSLLDQGYLANDAPPTIIELCETIGAVYYFRVTGSTAGMVWGVDIYTGDSAVAAAAVHAGLVKDGETAIVKVTVVAALNQYAGSTRNGVTSHEFGRFGTAYRLERV